MLPDGDGRDVCRAVRVYSRGADHHAHRARHRGRPHRRSRDRRRRLRRQAVQQRRADRADPRVASAHRRRDEGRRRHFTIGGLDVDEAQVARSPHGRRAARSLAQGIRSLVRARAQRRQRRHARGPDGRASGTRTGSARPRRSTCTSAGCARSSATTPAQPRYLHTVRGVGFRFTAPEEFSSQA